jgi:hypothetical protein
MRICLIIAAAVLMLGCNSQPRTSIPKDESIYRATFTTTKTRKQAFDALEVEMVRVFNNAKNVTQVTRPENGRIVAKALSDDVMVRDVDGFMTKLYGNMPYVLDIQADDNRLSISFEVSGPAEIRYGGGPYRSPEYPTDMRPVLLEFKAMAAALATAVSGTLKDETAIPKPVEKPASGESRQNDDRLP